MRRVIPRLVLLLVVGGALYFWSQLRRPRDLRVAVDLTSAMPGDVTEVDVIVRRGGRALARHEVQYGSAGAPGTVELIVHAPPGEAEVETTLGYARQPAHRSVARVELSPGEPAKVRAQ
jgi:hypothetical protein